MVLAFTSIVSGVVFMLAALVVIAAQFRSKRDDESDADRGQSLVIGLVIGFGLLFGGAALIDAGLETVLA